MPKISLLDVAKAGSTRAEIALIESVMTYAPELSIFPSEVIQDIEFMTLDRHSLPKTGFTAANEGIPPDKSQFKVRNHQCFIFRGAVNCDKAVADAFNLRRGAGRYQSIEAAGVGRSAFIELGKQIFYGIDNAENGFPGLKAMWEASKGLTSLSVDAGGTAANAATSVYAVKFGDEFCKVIFGGNKVLSLPPFKEQTLFDGKGGQYDGYVSNLLSWVGLQCANPFSIGRIYNLTAEAGKGLTDQLLADYITKCPVGFRPDAFFVTRQACGQLQKSRTVTLFGSGKGDVGSKSGNIAPRPTEHEGIPIIETDSILNTEAIVA